jgi:hypothetical protein
MATIFTEDQIKQLAANELGFPSGLDFSSTEDEAIIKINYSYDLIKEDTLSKYRWGFALLTVAMADREDVLDNKYIYRFPVPTDFLILRTLYRDKERNSVVSDFELYDGYIYTKEKELYITYSQLADEDKYPAYFVEYLKIKLAFDVCIDLTGNTELMSMLNKREQFEWIKSTNIDAREKKVGVIRSAPYITVRG